MMSFEYQKKKKEEEYGKGDKPGEIKARDTDRRWNLDLTCGL